MPMGSVDRREGAREGAWIVTNRITEWHREHYLCSTTERRATANGLIIGACLFFSVLDTALSWLNHLARGARTR